MIEAVMLYGPGFTVNLNFLGLLVPTVDKLLLYCSFFPQFNHLY